MNKVKVVEEYIKTKSKEDPRGSTRYIRTKGMSPCRLCGKSVGSWEYVHDGLC